MPFSEFLRRRVFEPLGMRSSWYVADALQGSGSVALAYQREGGGYRRHMRLGDQRGGGALLSTAGDLLRWNEALAGGRLGALVTARLQEPAKLNNGRALSYARGLRGRPSRWSARRPERCGHLCPGRRGFARPTHRTPKHTTRQSAPGRPRPAGGALVVASGFSIRPILRTRQTAARRGA